MSLSLAREAQNGQKCDTLLKFYTAAALRESPGISGANISTPAVNLLNENPSLVALGKKKWRMYNAGYQICKIKIR